mgnify:CR=1 FL=1
MIKNNHALLLVYVQKAFLEEDYPGLKRNNHNAECICCDILKYWRKLHLPVIHISYSSRNPNSKLYKSKPGFEFNDHVKPLAKETVLTKEVNSAFIGTNLEHLLHKSNIKTLNQKINSIFGK